jgi:hypothetical protein
MNDRSLIFRRRAHGPAVRTRHPASLAQDRQPAESHVSAGRIRRQ